MRQLFWKIRDKAGFSLVELMIVIVIIGVLAAVAVPIYNNNVTKARMSEADASLGSIRTQLRVHFGENGEYPTADEDVVGASWNDIKEGELTGTYFADSSYTYLSADGASFTLTCAAGDVLNSNRTLNQTGDFGGGI